MNAAYEQLIRRLDECDVSFFSNDERRTVCADFRCEIGVFRVVAVVEEEDNLFQVFGYSPLYVPKGARALIAETVTRANYGLRVGKFEMDMDSGQLRFQVAQVLSESQLESEVIDRTMSTVMSMLDLYLPAVFSVIYGNEIPKDAIACVEAGFHNNGESD
jgi:hypothetical protein